METTSNLGTRARSELTAYQLQAYAYIPYSYTSPYNFYSTGIRFFFLNSRVEHLLGTYKNSKQQLAKNCHIAQL